LIFFEEEGIHQKAVSTDFKWCGGSSLKIVMPVAVVMNFNTQAALKGCAFASNAKSAKDIMIGNNY
jgi:hypothetical protein